MTIGSPPRCCIASGCLQASLGNHGAALRYLRRRDELPHVRKDEELGLRVAIARSAWHSGDNELAKEQMLAAAELVQKTPALGHYEALVVDRLGLALAAAGDAHAARDRYAELDGLLQRDPVTPPLNQVKAKVGLAASALVSGQARKAIDSLTQAEQRPERERAARSGARCGLAPLARRQLPLQSGAVPRARRGSARRRRSRARR